MFKIIFTILLISCSSISWSSKFSLDKFDIEINSNFLGEEVVYLGKKMKKDLIIILKEQKNKENYLKSKRSFLD